METDFSRATFAAPPGAPKRVDHEPPKTFRFRVRADLLAAELARLGCTQDELARLCGLTPALLASMLAFGATGKNARRMANGLRRLSVAADLIAEAQA